MRYTGLKDGMRLIDLGCGSGRLASVLGRSMKIEYTGIDIIQSLLDYAKSKSPINYRFLLHRALCIPAPADVCEFVGAFSVFTHLLPAESFIYLEDIRRVLKPGGKLVFSFLEFCEDSHWSIFEATVKTLRQQSNAPLNTFIDRSVIEIWSKRRLYSGRLYFSHRNSMDWWTTGTVGCDSQKAVSDFRSLWIEPLIFFFLLEYAESEGAGKRWL